LFLNWVAVSEHVSTENHCHPLAGPPAGHHPPGRRQRARSSHAQSELPGCSPYLPAKRPRPPGRSPPTATRATHTATFTVYSDPRSKGKPRQPAGPFAGDGGSGTAASQVDEEGKSHEHIGPPMPSPAAGAPRPTIVSPDATICTAQGQRERAHSCRSGVGAGGHNQLRGRAELGALRAAGGPSGGYAESKKPADAPAMTSVLRLAAGRPGQPAPASLRSARGR
jgi:hypothetical protein